MLLIKMLVESEAFAMIKILIIPSTVSLIWIIYDGCTLPVWYSKDAVLNYSHLSCHTYATLISPVYGFKVCGLLLCCIVSIEGSIKK